MKARLFKWEDYRRWRPIILSALSPWLGVDVLARLKTNRPKGFYSDDLDWLDEAIWAERGEVVDIKQTLTNLLPDCFSFVRAYHGTRAASEESFRRHGILPSCPNRLREQARRIFDATALARVANKLEGDFLGQNQGTVWFCLAASELVDHSTHYVQYGSELLQGVFGHSELRKYGRGMLIECQVPTAAIEGGFLACLAGELLSEIAEKYCLGRRERNPNFGFCIKETLAPENIIQIHYPSVTRDQFAES